jgi:hypothetical protein
MPNLRESISQAMDNLPAIFMYTGSDGAEYSEDPNLNDIYHLAETIRDVYKLSIEDAAYDQSISKEQAVEIVELVEKELLSHPAMKPILRDPFISDPHAIRVKDDNQLTILKPRVPIKLANSIGKSEIFSLFCMLATIRCYLASLSTFQ